MKTEIITDEIEKAASYLRNGGLVAVPTETVYGLACNGLDEAAVKKLYVVKGRPEVKALSMMVPDCGAMETYCTDVPQVACTLAEHFWPGPLTLILQSSPLVPEITRAGGSTIALRCPDHPATLKLLRCCGLPLAAPSANPSGMPSPKTAQTVVDYFDGMIDGVIDGGPCRIGMESTIVDLSSVPYRVLRKGALPESEIFSVLRDTVRLIGITGGSGSGKTTALQVLRERGAMILDCDEIYHELTTNCIQMREELTDRFGDVFDGINLDRKKLGDIVFSNPDALADLNAITHKYVSNALDERLTDYALNGGRLAAIDAIGLLDIPHSKRTIANVAVTAPLNDRIRRLMRRDGISEAYARKRINAQKTDAYFAEHCDAVLHNDGTIKEFEHKCNVYFSEVLKDV